MTQSVNDAARQVEITVNTIRTRVGKRVSMERLSNPRGSGEQRIQDTRLVKRRSIASMAHEESTYTQGESETKEYCQFVEDSPTEETSWTYETEEDIKEESPQPPPCGDERERVYKDIVTTMNLVEDTPEHQVYFRNSSHYKTQYLSLKRDKEQYEEEKRWERVKMAANLEEQAINLEMPTKPPDKVSSKEKRKNEPKPAETDGETPDQLKAYVRKVEEMFWTASQYFTPLIINNNPVRACILDWNSRSNTMPKSWVKILEIKGDFFSVNRTLNLDGSAGTIDYVSDIGIQVGKSQFYAKFELVEEDDEHEGFIILGKCFLEETNAVLDFRRGIMTLRSATGYRSGNLLVRRQPMVFIHGEWVNLGLMEFYYYIVMSTKTLPHKPIVDGYDVTGKLILELLDKYASKRTRVESHKSQNTPDIPTGSYPRKQLSNFNHKKIKDENSDEDSSCSFSSAELNHFRQCPEEDVPIWIGALSLLGTKIEDEYLDALFRSVLLL